MLQCLSLLEQEKCAVQEKLSNTQADLGDAKLDIERLRREAAAQKEQDHQVQQDLHSELKHVKQQLEDEA